MSRPIATLLLLATAVASSAQPYGPPPPRAVAKTPVQVLNSQYDEHYGPRRNGRPCRVQRGEDIVVCADASGTSSPYRIPLPDDRTELGDRVVRVSEAPLATRMEGHCNRPGCADPPKLMETLGTIISALKGEDPQ